MMGFVGSIISEWHHTLFPLRVSQNEYLLKAGWEKDKSNSFSPSDTFPNTALVSAIFRQR